VQIILSFANRVQYKIYEYFQNGNTVEFSFFEQKPLQYIISKGIMYPLTSSFRALVLVNEATEKYSWKKGPFKIWSIIGAKLVAIVLDAKAENPDSLAKSSNLWGNLFKEGYIAGYLS
jgi:hypothetical protein